MSIGGLTSRDNFYGTTGIYCHQIKIGGKYDLIQLYRQIINKK